MASQTSTRRGVLSEIDINAAISSPSGPFTGSKAKSPEKPRKLAEALLQTVLKGGDVSNAVHEKLGLAGTKRCEADMPEILSRSAKKLKTDAGEGASVRVNGSKNMLPQGLSGGKDFVEGVQSKAPLSPDRLENSGAQLSSPPSISPGSSSGYSDSALNDTQLTEPDESPIISVLSPAEIRERARAIKLRLRLAGYKVRTNQIDLPMSRLQIRTTNFERLPTSLVKRQRQTPLPETTASNIPNIKVQNVSAETRRTEVISSSPPPIPRSNSLPSNKTFKPVSPSKDEEREEFATPLLPRHHQGLRNPLSLGSPIWDEKRSPGPELTSSVVKGRAAANGLLSLMLQR